MKWWNDLWLKESFAAYLENLPLEKEFPSWDLKASHYLKPVSAALVFDSSIYTHPIQITEEDPAEMEKYYDQITYEKVELVLLFHFSVFVVLESANLSVYIF